MNKVILGLAFSLMVILGLTQNIYADRRSYVWTYEYMTMPRGMWELEYYLTTEVKDINRSNINTLKQWLELEYGITDKWDLSLYQMWKFNNKRFENDSEYDGFKIRTRYRFGERGKFFVDPLLYLEYIRDNDFSKPNIGEAKLILARDIYNFNLSYNQVVKRNLEKEGKTDHEYALGVSYGFLPVFRLGLESKGNYSANKYAIGPAVSFAAGKFWVTLGAVFGLNERTDDIQTRMIVVIPF